jgi:autotransporter-associated beta strand protein
MSIKTTLNLVESRGLSTKFKKIINYFSIFTIVLGSTFGSLNSANAATFSLGDGLASAVAEITDTTQDDASAVALSADSSAAIRLDGDGKIDTAVDITAATLTFLGDETTNVLTIESAAKTFTISGAITTTASDTGTLALTETDAVLVLSGTGVLGNEEDHLLFTAAANTTITLSADTTYSANFDGAGTLKVTGTVVLDEAVGGTTDMGVLDVDGQITSTDTINPDVLDLDGTIAGATSLINDTTSALNGSITTTGVTTLTGAVTLDGNSDITTTNSAITLTGAVNGAFNLTTNAGTAKTHFGSTVGNSTAVGAIHATGLLDVDGDIKNGSGAGAASLTATDAATFDGDVFTSGIISLEQVITESATTLNADDANITISAAADSDGGAADALTVDAGTGNITISGAVGGSNVLGAIGLTGAEVNVESTVALGGTLTVTNTGDSELTGIVSGAQAVTKAGTGQLTIRAVNTFTGDLTVSAGSVVMLGNIDAAIDIGAAGTVILDDTQVADSVVSATSNDGVITSGAVIKMPANLKTTEKIVWSDGADNAGAQITALNAAILDNAMFDYVATDAGDDTHITATAKSAATTATELSVTNNQSVALAQALTAATNDTTADATAEDAFANALNATGFSATEDTALAQQVAPQSDLISGSSFAAQAVTGSIQGVMSERMASLRSGDAYFGTGVAAGGMSAQSGFIQVFGSAAEQKKYNSWSRITSRL